MNKQYNLVDICDKYNKYIKLFITIIDKSMENISESESEYFNLLKKKVFMVIDHEPLMLLQQSGPYIYKFREEIHNNDISKLFNECDVDNISTYINNEVSDENKQDSANIQRLFHCLKVVWFKYSPDEQKKVLKILKHIVSEYSKYVLIKS